MHESEFDPRLADWLREGPSGASGWVLGAVVDHARRHPRRSLRARWSDLMSSTVAAGRATTPAFRLATLLALLALAVALAGVVYIGAQQRALVPPSPALYACPPGTSPDQPGLAYQKRPNTSFAGPATFDERAGRIVYVSNDYTTSATTAAFTIWSFDVCTNTWSPGPVGSGDYIRGVVYDPTARLTVLIGDYHLWSYDSATRRLTQGATVRLADGTVTGPTGKLAVYDPISRRILVLTEIGAMTQNGYVAQGFGMYAVDAAAGTWTEIAMHGDVPRPPSGDLMAYDASTDRVVLYGIAGNAHLTYEFDPRTRTWSEPDISTPGFGFAMGDLTGYQIAYDAANRRTVIFSDGRLAAYHATAHAWEILVDEPGQVREGSIYRNDHSMVYDPVNQRLVMIGGSYRTGIDPKGWSVGNDVLAFDLGTRTWTQLVGLGDWGAVAVCPAGSTPDRSGPADQARPAIHGLPRGPYDVVLSAAFDRQSGRLVIAARDATGLSATPWSLDVCTNTWRQGTADLPDGTLAYDPGTDLVVDFAEQAVVAFDVDTDTSTRRQAAPSAGPWLAAYDSKRDVLWVRDATTGGLWIYDVRNDYWWPQEDQRGDVPRRSVKAVERIAYDASADRLVLYSVLNSTATNWTYDTTYEFDPATETWTDPHVLTPPPDWFQTASATYDEANARTVLVSGGWIADYDAAAHRWHVAAKDDFTGDGIGTYDPVNGRVVIIVVGDGVVGFDLANGSWLDLLGSTGS